MRRHGVVHIGIVTYRGAQLSAALGLADLFDVAEELLAARRPEVAPQLVVSRLLFDVATGVMLTEGADETFAKTPLTAILLPPSRGEPPVGDEFAPLLPWLRAQREEGAILASVCAGAFLLARAGLLEGKPATTHWALVDDFRAMFPDIALQPDRLLVTAGDIITAGGLMAWTDLGLLIVERLFGAEAMIETARFLLIDPPGREQRYYSDFRPSRGHGDPNILKAQQWFDSMLSRDVSVEEMAGVAGLEPRTFLRRFQKALGLKPIEYCQQMRVAEARRRLETSAASIDQIGWECGYRDPASFRKIFLRIVGLTPADYRRRFHSGDMTTGRD
ncbi:transcriptional regulator GlxA family with amidase domain [Rhizobium sp. SG_E_25_P2]|uniref:GlxA family transcriptional regulator n=1 Tax=Rhizobium sp. SG_E_25_P2 TaxID=2879942 RepID=UPI00247473B7|nr:GlxA family transcriptional regulator [Rhizobium sp. SG_E_25_P2]MDH6266343.1 transcriptional regulator GlxA family with amidase domain [Rhizobium sp. SG_E_25_P2]